MADILEKDIQRQCINWLLREAKTFAWRNNSTGVFDREKGFFRTAPKRGAPDIIVIDHRHNGRFIGIEVKRPGGKMSEEQENFRISVEVAKGEYWLIHSVAELALKWYAV